MKKRGKIGSYFSRLTGGSRIWSRFFSVTAGSEAGASRGLTEDKLLSDGVLGTAYGMLCKGCKAVREACAAYAAESKVVSFITSFLRGILNTSLGSVGVFLFFVGLYSAAAYFIHLYAGDSADILTLVYSGVIAFCGLLLLPLRRSVLGGIGRGGIITYVVEEMLGISRFALETDTPNGKRHIGWAVLFGTVVGVAGFFVSPIKILAYILLFALFAVFLYSPEGGLYISVFLLPIAPPAYSAAVALTAGAGYIFKAFTGKRNFYLCAADVFVLLFAFAFGIAAAITPFGYGSAALSAVTVAVLYVLCVNLMRSGEQIYRLMSAITTGGLILALCCIFDFFFAGELGAFGMFLSARTSLYGLIPLLIPAALCVACCRGFFSTGTFTVLALCTAAVLSFEEWMYIAVIAVAAVYFLIAFRHRGAVLLCTAIACGSVLLLFGTGIIDGVMFGEGAVYKSALDVAGKYAFSGVGVGEAPFTFAFRSGGYASSRPTDIFTALTIAGGFMLPVLFVIALVFLLRRGVSVMKGKSVSMFKLPASAVLAYVCASVFFGSFAGAWEIPANIMLFSVLCGCLSGLPRVYDREVGEDYEEI